MDTCIYMGDILLRGVHLEQSLFFFLFNGLQGLIQLHGLRGFQRGLNCSAFLRSRGA